MFLIKVWEDKTTEQTFGDEWLYLFQTDKAEEQASEVNLSKLYWKNLRSFSDDEVLVPLDLPRYMPSSFLVKWRKGTVLADVSLTKRGFFRTIFSLFYVTTG